MFKSIIIFGFVSAQFFCVTLNAQPIDIVKISNRSAWSVYLSRSVKDMQLWGKNSSIEIKPFTSMSLLNYQIPQLFGEFFSFVSSDALCIEFYTHELKKSYVIFQDSTGVRCYYMFNSNPFDSLVASVDFSCVGIRNKYYLELIIAGSDACIEFNFLNRQ